MADSPGYERMNGSLVSSRPLIDTQSDEIATIGTLARKSISLDPYAALTANGDWQSAPRYRSSLVAYDAALRQSNPDVATILLVTAIEALIAPEMPWKTRRTTKRFVQSVLEYAPAAVDEILNHANLEEALGFHPTGGPSNRRRRLVEHIYDLRSTPAHSGPSMELGFMDQDKAMGSVRVAMLSDLCRDVILSFLVAPRSSLIGHPTVDPEPDSIAET